MKVTDVIAIIEDTANPVLQAHWDKSGIQIIAEREEVSYLAIMLDPLPRMVSRALEAGADFILTHHPLSLKPTLPNRLNNYYKTLKAMMRANAWLYAAHTSLDVNLAGPAGWLGRELRLTNTQPLEKLGGQTDLQTGFGQIGDLPEPESFGRLINHILKLAKIECANLAGSIPEGKCERVAWCGGSGASLLEEATQSGAQIYITGDIKYHTAIDTEIPVLDVGHHSLEEEMMRRFALLLNEEMPQIRIEFFPSTAPFKRACQ